VTLEQQIKVGVRDDNLLSFVSRLFALRSVTRLACGWVKF